MVLDAARNGEVEILQSILDQHPSLREARLPGKNLRPMHLSASYAHTSAVQVLLHRGAELEARDGEGWTPLMCAVAEGAAEVVRLLCKHGANVHSRSLEDEGMLDVVDSDPVRRILQQAGAK
ncbi:MAG: ankyrin repeat-containing domain protein [Piptocephalis tieghemiana]|nr:MAG: ankyrin repeat-containing domain protein [Piptocephalis tieghemiana]